MCGDLPILNEFVCHSEEKSDGQISCVSEPLFNGSEKPVVNSNGIAVFIKNDGSWLYLMEKIPHEVQVTLSADRRVIRLYAANPGTGESESIQRNLLRVALECVMLCKSRISLHSACIDDGGEAVAFTGTSGMGKSTRADSWIKANGAEFISGDRPVLCFLPDGVTVSGVPWDGKEQIFRCVERPLKAILDVRRSELDYLRKLDSEQARFVLMKQAFIPMWDTDAAFTAVMLIKKIAETVPVYRVFCGPDAENARNIRRILFENPEEILEEAKEVKIKENFVLRNIADEYIVMPTGGSIADFDGAVVLNEVSAFIFEKLCNSVTKEDLVMALLNEYDVDFETAQKDVEALISKFDEMGIIE